MAKASPNSLSQQTESNGVIKKKKKWCIYIAPLSQTSQRRFTMINLPPADWKHIQAQIAAASKQSMHAGNTNLHERTSGLACHAIAHITLITRVNQS